jgi:hypothetical protein
MALTVARLIWLRRNDLVFEREFTAPSKLVQVARRMVGDFNHVMQTPIEQTRGLSGLVHSPPHALIRKLTGMLP